MAEESTPAPAGPSSSWHEKVRTWVRVHPRASLALGLIFLTLLSTWLLLFAGLPDEKEIQSFKLKSTAQLGKINWDRRFKAPVRVWKPLSQISSLLQQAVVISEDDLFYQHEGFNIEMMKEAWRVNLEKKRYVRGASTITMQLARNAFLQDRSKTILRKVRELILTHRLESALTKKQILELYLNVVEWGEGIYGAEAAARFYFGKSAAQLHLAEASLLAAMLPNPIYFNPYKRMKSCARMQKRVLDLMVLNHAITPEEAAAAGPSSLSLRGAPPPAIAAAPPTSPDSLALEAEIDELLREAEHAVDSSSRLTEPFQEEPPEKMEGPIP
ncbi:MAG: monofunctional biosynthetic peptidoglycan transglycosylase [bacterium]